MRTEQSWLRLPQPNSGGRFSPLRERPPQIPRGADGAHETTFQNYNGFDLFLILTTDVGGSNKISGGGFVKQRRHVFQV